MKQEAQRRARVEPWPARFELRPPASDEPSGAVCRSPEGPGLPAVRRAWLAQLQQMCGVDGQAEIVCGCKVQQQPLQRGPVQGHGDGGASRCGRHQ